MELPWWAWVILGVIGFVTLLVFAAIRFRRRVRGEFIAALRERYPEAEVGDVNIALARIRPTPGADWVTFNFLQLERQRSDDASRPTLPTVRLWVREIMAVLYVVNNRKLLNLLVSFQRNPPLRR